MDILLYADAGVRLWVQPGTLFLGTLALENLPVLSTGMLALLTVNYARYLTEKAVPR
jgi:hypothetical protein